LPTNSIDCVVGSPPYYGLRQYEGVGPTVWPAMEYKPMPVPGMAPITLGPRFACEHKVRTFVDGELHWEPTWSAEQVQHQRGQVGDRSTLDGGPQSGGDGRVQEVSQGQWCRLCGAWRGTLGNEPTLEMYVGHLVLIMREVRRVLKPHGTLWLVAGDSYVGSGPNRQAHVGNLGAKVSAGADTRGGVSGLKPKDLALIPHRVALALQADDWWVRCDNIWAKGRDGDVGDVGYGAAMPMSRTDAPTHAHEVVLQCAQSKRYYYDAVAVRQHWTDWSESNPEKRHKSHHLRSVWLLSPGGGYSGAHFAPFPRSLAALCIEAGTSAKGVCRACGAPWERITERHRTCDGKPVSGAWEADEAGRLGAQGVGHWRFETDFDTLGWRPTCDCDAGEPEPAVVLDPFVGSGTTLLEARRLGRRGIGLDASWTYLYREATQRLEWDKVRAWEGEDGNGRDGRGHEAQPLADLPMFRAMEAT
jgi:DNA modification methylase